MGIKVGINGFGRIGRNILRASMLPGDIDFVAVNDITDTKTLAHLIKYDSVLGNLDADIKAGDNSITVNGDEFRVFSEHDPAKINWASVGAEIVVESTGMFTNREQAQKHPGNAVKKVIISAPAIGEDITVVLGVNHEAYNPQEHYVTISPTKVILLPTYNSEVLKITLSVHQLMPTKRHCGNCGDFLELDRPKQARYCKLCGKANAKLRERKKNLKKTRTGIPLIILRRSELDNKFLEKNKIPIVPPPQRRGGVLYILLILLAAFSLVTLISFMHLKSFDIETKISHWESVLIKLAGLTSVGCIVLHVILDKVKSLLSSAK